MAPMKLSARAVFAKVRMTRSSFAGRDNVFRRVEFLCLIPQIDGRLTPVHLKKVMVPWRRIAANIAKLLELLKKP